VEGKRVVRGPRAKLGLTGIQTAIILIAFVIVASVFAFAVLNMGLLTTQRAGETVSAGMQQAASALQLAGSVIAYDTDGDDKADKIEIYVAVAPGKEPVDFTEGRLVISYTNARVHEANIYVSGGTTNAEASIEWVKGDGDKLLEFGEKLKITITLKSTDAQLGPNEWFKVEIKPPAGATLSIERWTPAAIDPVMDLG